MSPGGESGVWSARGPPAVSLACGLRGGPPGSECGVWSGGAPGLNPRGYIGTPSSAALREEWVRFSEGRGRFETGGYVLRKEGAALREGWVVWRGPPGGESGRVPPGLYGNTVVRCSSRRVGTFFGRKGRRRRGAQAVGFASQVRAVRVPSVKRSVRAVGESGCGSTIRPKTLHSPSGRSVRARLRARASSGVLVR